MRIVRSAMRHMGGVRLDHVMGLFRLFWIPQGKKPKDGAYVRYSALDLLGIVALESVRAGAIVVGEDLGTVEDQVRSELAFRKMLSYRVLWFESEPPATYPEHALAAVTTHDLPTIAGLWSGSDIRKQRELHLAPNEKGTRAHAPLARQAHRSGPTLCHRSGRPENARSAREGPFGPLGADPRRRPGGRRRPNMPGTIDEYPCWCLPLPARSSKSLPIPASPASPKPSPAAPAASGRDVPRGGLERGGGEFGGRIYWIGAKLDCEKQKNLLCDLPASPPPCSLTLAHQKRDGEAA